MNIPMTAQEAKDGVETLRKIVSSRIVGRGASIATEIRVPVSVLTDFSNGITAALSDDRMVALSKVLCAHHEFDVTTRTLRPIHRAEPRPLHGYQDKDFRGGVGKVGAGLKPVSAAESKGLTERWRTEMAARRVR